MNPILLFTNSSPYKAALDLPEEMAKTCVLTPMNEVLGCLDQMYGIEKSCVEQSKYENNPQIAWIGGNMWHFDWYKRYLLALIRLFECDHSKHGAIFKRNRPAGISLSKRVTPAPMPDNVIVEARWLEAEPSIPASRAYLKAYILENYSYIDNLKWHNDIIPEWWGELIYD